MLRILAADEARRASATDEDRPNHEIGLGELVQNGVTIAEEGSDVLGQNVVEVTQPIEVRIENADGCTEARSDARGLSSHDASAQYRNVRGFDAGHAAEQDPPTFLRSLEVLRTLLNAHSPGDLTHGSEQAQVAPKILQGFVGDGSRSRSENSPCECLARCEVKIRKDELPRSEEHNLARLRLLDLHDELRASEHRFCIFDDGGAAVFVLGVTDPASRTEPALDEHLVTAPRQLFDAHGKHAGAIFVAFDLFGDPDDHTSKIARGLLVRSVTMGVVVKSSAASVFAAVPPGRSEEAGVRRRGAFGTVPSKVDGDGWGANMGRCLGTLGSSLGDPQRSRAELRLPDEVVYRASK
ncbi:MAG: hypothetical protein QM784_27230 [Polyangiaceae bacterium]